jgi:hypothetical protein
MKKLVIFLMIVGLLAITGTASAQLAKVGSSGMQFLKIGVGARALGMAETYVSIADDPTCLFWNPGGLARVNGTQFFGSYTRWVAEIDLTAMAFTHNMGTAGTIGFSFMALTTGYMNVTTVNHPFGNGETFTFSDYAFGLSYGKMLTDRFSIGGTIRYIQESLGAVDDNAFLFDVGTVYDVGYKDVSLGMSITNFGTEMHFPIDDDGDGDIDEDFRNGHDDDNDGLVDEDTKEDPVPAPIVFRFGASVPIIKDDVKSIRGCFELAHYTDNVEGYNVGFEASYQNMIMLRGGYMTKTDEGGLAVGAGFRMDVLDIGKVALDYSLTDKGRLGLIHRGSVSIAF